MVLGAVLLVDAVRRLFLEIYRTTRPKAPAVVAPPTKKSEEKIPTFEEAA